MKLNYKNTNQKVLILFLILNFFTIVKINAQTHQDCWAYPNTTTTDPNTTPNNGNTFDWTQDNTVNWFYDASKPVWPLHLPYFCDGNQSSANNDGCSNENIALYSQIKLNNPGLNGTQLNMLYDILPSNGWELVSYDFGVPPNNTNPIPHIILYNKYTGKLKIFALAVASSGSSVGNSRAAIYVTWHGGSSKTALFSHATAITKPIKIFNTSSDIAAPNGIASLNGLSTPRDYQWLSAEMVAAYDPCTCRNSIDGKGDPEIDVVIKYFTQSDVSLVGTVEGEASPSSVSYYNANGLAGGVNYNYNSSFLTDLQGGKGSVLQGYNSWDDFAAALANNLSEQSGSSTSISTNNLFINNIASDIYYQNNLGVSGQTQTFINTAVYNYLTTNPTNASTAATNLFSETNVQNYLSIITSAAIPYVSQATGIIDLLLTIDANGTPTPPTVSAVHQELQLTGTIESQSTLNQFTKALPGSNNSYGTSSQAPVYNNILGVLNILDIPQVNIVNLGITNETTGGEKSVSNGPWPFENATVKTVPFKAFDYKLNDDLKYVLNPASNLTVQSIQAAFVFEYNNDDKLFLDPNNNNQKQIPYYPNMKVSWDETSSTWANIPTLDDVVANLQASGLELEFQSQGYTGTDGSSVNIPGSKIRFRTKYVPLQCLKDIDFIMCGGSNNLPNTYIKFYCKLKRPDGGILTAIYTFDAKEALLGGTTTTSLPGGTVYSLSYFYHDFFNVSHTFLDIDNLYIYGYYNTANYGSQPGGTYAGGGSYISTGDINTGTSGISIYDATNPSTKYIELATQGNINFNGDTYINFDYQITPDALITVIAGGNINALGISEIASNTKIYCGNTINNFDSFVSGVTGTGVQIYANNTINFVSSYNDNGVTLIGGTNAGVQVYTGNAMDLPAGMTISGEVTLSVNSVNIPSITSVLHGCVNPDPISNYEEKDVTTITGICSGNGERLMASNNNKPSITQPSKKTDMTLTKLGTVANIKLGIYPNPTSGVVYLNLSAQNAGNLLVSLSTMDGSQVMQNSFNCNEGANSFKINLSDLTQGVYFINITDENGEVIKNDKIVLMPQ